MVYGQGPQLDPHHPSHTFAYVISGDPRCRAITVVASTKTNAKRHAGEHLDRWHGSGRWEWSSQMTADERN